MNVHRLIRGKFHLHYSHITGKIFGYAHYFCNSTYIEKSTPEIPFVAHNFFRFDLFYFMKAYMRHLGVQKLWILAVLILHKQIRSIDSLKFYQRSLDELSSTLTAEEKIAVKKLAEKFLNEHFYFSTVWPYLSLKKKEKILEIISEGKGIIPYELIVDIESFYIKPETDFWEKNWVF